LKDKNHIPKSKFDFDAIDCLEQMLFEDIRADVPKLLEWLQDANWPIAYRLALYLGPYINEITEEIVFVLTSDDATWKYHLSYNLIGRSQKKLTPLLINALTQLAENPTKHERDEYVDEAARDLLAKKDLCG
jgi:hypothetical protein